MLAEELARQGNHFFRWRSYLPLLTVSLFLPAFWSYDYPGGSHALDQGWEMGCLALSLMGWLIRIITVGYAAPGTSGGNTRRQIAASLNTTGMYAIVRHPLYLGNFLMWLGFVLLWRQPWLVLLWGAIFWLYYERIMYAEEQFLAAKFGTLFTDWARQTPLFLPRPWRWQPPGRPFNWRQALKREYSSFYALISAFMVFELISSALVEGLAGDRLWWSIFGAATAAYLTIRFYKKRGKL